VLRDTTGHQVTTIEKADGLAARGVGLEAADAFRSRPATGVTDLRGLMFRPTRFDPSRKYPIIKQHLPGATTGERRTPQFLAARGDHAGSRRTRVRGGADRRDGHSRNRPGPSRGLYGNLGDNGLPDQVAGMKQLADRFSGIELDRAGIYGTPAAGYAAAGAMFRYPDFFKVGVSQARQPRQPGPTRRLGEKWQGLPPRPTATARRTTTTRRTNSWQRT